MRSHILWTTVEHEYQRYTFRITLGYGVPFFSRIIGLWIWIIHIKQSHQIGDCDFDV